MPPRKPLGADELEAKPIVPSPKRLSKAEQAKLLQEEFSDLPGVKPTAPAAEPTPAPVPSTSNTAKRSTKKRSPTAPQQDRKMINVDMGADRHARLLELAAQVRGNNTEPTPMHLRVFPQNLIRRAVDILLTLDIDWSQPKNMDELEPLIQSALAKYDSSESDP